MIDIGWLDPQLIEKYQFEASAADAWEKNGGGTFSYKDPLGTGKKRSGNTRVNARVKYSFSSTSHAHGYSYGQAVAQMMFKKNPNMYFYRHNEPGVVSSEKTQSNIGSNKTVDRNNGQAIGLRKRRRSFSRHAFNVQYTDHLLISLSTGC